MGIASVTRAAARAYGFVAAVDDGDVNSRQNGDRANGNPTPTQRHAHETSSDRQVPVQSIIFLVVTRLTGMSEWTFAAFRQESLAGNVGRVGAWASLGRQEWR